jgi:hypothetical protein
MCAPTLVFTFSACLYVVGIPAMHAAIDDDTWRNFVYTVAMLLKSVAEKTLLFALSSTGTPTATGDLMLFALEAITSLQSRFGN